MVKQIKTLFNPLVVHSEVRHVGFTQPANDHHNKLT